MTARAYPIVTDEQWPQSILGLREGFAGRLNVYRMMAHHPDLLSAWANLRNHIVLKSALTPQQSEIVILRAGWRWQSRYEWMHHVSRGRKVGLDDATIARCRAPAPSIEDEAGLLIAAVDALLDGGRIKDPLLADLTATLGTKGILDVMATVGMYSTLGFILESFGVPLDQEIELELKGDALAAWVKADDDGR